MPPPPRPQGPSGRPPRRPTGHISVPVDSELLKKLEGHAQARQMTVQQFASRALRAAANAPIQAAPGKKKDGDGAWPMVVLLVIVAGLVAFFVWKAGGFH
jgi:hypothetical protein